MAQGINLWTFQKYNDIIDAIEVGVDLAETVVRIANHLADVFLQFTIIGDEALDGLVDFAQNAVDTTVDLLRAADTTDVREGVACALYCRLLESSGDFTQEVKDAWILDILGIGTLDFYVPFAAFVALIDLNTWRMRARANDENEGDCDLCGCLADCPEDAEWISIITGSALELWTSDLGAYTDGAYHSDCLVQEALPAGATYEYVQIHQLFTPTVINRIIIRGHVELGHNDSILDSQIGAGNGSYSVIRNVGITASGDYEIVWTGSALLDRIRPQIVAGYDAESLSVPDCPGGSATITAIIICGEGDRPSELP